MTSPRPNISYGDILNSMNVQLVNGVLVYKANYTPKANQILEQNQILQPVTATSTKQVKLTNQPIPDELKKSKIYNKYFSHYKEEEEEVEVRKPKTLEEYKRMITEDKIKRFLAKKRIEKIKPKTMFFQNNGTNTQRPYFPSMESNFHFK
jgi:hypothetical protein